MKTRHLVLVLLGISLSWTTQAQRIDPAVIAVSGNFAQTSSVSISWTIGQTAVDLRYGHFGTLSEGFQQAFLTAIPIKDRGLPFTLDIYPNPTRYSVLVNISGAQDDMTLVLYNMLGESVRRQNVPNGDQRVRLSFETLPSGMYLLVAFSGAGEQLALYKIVKAE